ncbi:hypothetical protein AWL63_18885 [Sphingomonas panacis]|uniref:Uncharacterized protein n=2 Tax=Sphingomonas panacis TaxID=1560345 RepID=A0A1B3ZE45_9SPHN|nr:hypothetical protein AWL63_18885 [Sphingomonas panacis]
MGADVSIILVNFGICLIIFPSVAGYIVQKHAFISILLILTEALFLVVLGQTQAAQVTDVCLDQIRLAQKQGYEILGGNIRCVAFEFSTANFLKWWGYLLPGFLAGMAVSLIKQKIAEKKMR